MGLQQRDSVVLRQHDWRPWRGHRRRRGRRNWSRRTRRWVKVTKPAPAPGTPPPPGIEHVTSAPGIAHTAHSPVIEHVSLSTCCHRCIACSTLRRRGALTYCHIFFSVIGFVAPSPAAAHAAPAPVTEHVAPASAVTLATPAQVCGDVVPAPMSRSASTWHLHLPLSIQRLHQGLNT